MLLDAARESVAGTLGAHADEVSFCASGTQAAHLAVLGSVGRTAPGAAARHIVVSVVEHSAVLEAVRRHEATGGRRCASAWDRSGRVDPAELASAVRTETTLVALQQANSEVGTVQPVEEAAAACAAAGVPLYVDAAQALGRVPTPAGWSLLTASAHKWGGPAGVGVLAVCRGTRWRSPLPSDEREGGRVPGFENVTAVVAAAAALEAVTAEMAAESARLHQLVDRIRHAVAATVPDVEVVGDPERRLPHIVTFSCLYVDGESLVLALDREGFAVSSGSACTTSSLEPSHVLEAMGGPHTRQRPGVAAARCARDRGRALPRGAAHASWPTCGRKRGGCAVSGTEVPGGADGLHPGSRSRSTRWAGAAPSPVIELARHIGEVDVGGVVAVVCDDVAARTDVPAWCRMRGHEHLGEEAASHAATPSSSAASTSPPR
jgi:cysteine desulfurase